MKIQALGKSSSLVVMCNVLTRSKRVEKEDYASYIVDMREYDVIYYQRVSIDTGTII